MSVERDSMCFHLFAHTWHTRDQYIVCTTCGQRQTPAGEDYTDHDVWGRAWDYPALPAPIDWERLVGPYLKED